MGTKKMLGCLAKFWVNGHCLSEKCRFFGVIMSNDFCPLETPKVMKIQENGMFLKKARSFYSKFC